MELHLGSLFATASETNGTKLYSKLNDILFKHHSELKQVLEELGKLAPSTVGPLQHYLINDKIEDMVENVFYDLLREGTPLSEKDQHKLKDYYGLNESHASKDEKGYHAGDEMMQHLLHAYTAKKFGKMDLHKKHMDYAMDHASNNEKENFTRKELEEMVDNGKEMFHDMDEDEIKNAPTEFVKSPWDSAIGK